MWTYSREHYFAYYGFLFHFTWGYDSGWWHRDMVLINDALGNKWLNLVFLLSHLSLNGFWISGRPSRQVSSPISDITSSMPSLFTAVVFTCIFGAISSDTFGILFQLSPLTPTVMTTHIPGEMAEVISRNPKRSQLPNAPSLRHFTLSYGTPQMIYIRLTNSRKISSIQINF